MELSWSPIALLTATFLGGWATAQAGKLDDVIPPERYVDWRPGIPGGIPERTDICATVPPGADAATRIEAAIDACPAGQVVLLEAGDYLLGTDTLEVTKGVSVRGAGPRATRILYEGSDVAIEVGRSSPGPIQDIQGSAPKGATQILLESDSTTGAGDYVVVHQLSPALVDTFACGYCCEDRSSTRNYESGERCISQIVPVERREADNRTLVLARPLYFDYPDSQDPEIYEWGMVERAGLEDLYVERVSADGGMTADIIRFYGCAHCWVQNVETFRGQGAHVKLWFSYGCEIRDSFFNFGHNSMGSEFGYDSGRNYGLFVWMVNSDHLIENNIIHSTRHAMIFEGGGSGVVYAYNYALNGLVYADADWVAGDASTHGSHPHMNLFEGNVNERLSWDYTHGSDSHNTAFRNHIYRDSPGKTGGLRCVDIMRANTYANIVGNVLCSPGCEGEYLFGPADHRSIYRLGYLSDGDGDHDGVDPEVAETLLRHGNYDYISASVRWDHPDNVVDPATRSLPDSLYLDIRPAFFGSLAWPPFGPDVAGYAAELPAKVCYQTYAQHGEFDAEICYGSSNPDTNPPAAPANLQAQ